MLFDIQVAENQLVFGRFLVLVDEFVKMCGFWRISAVLWSCYSVALVDFLRKFGLFNRFF